MNHQYLYIGIVCLANLKKALGLMFMFFYPRTKRFNRPNWLLIGNRQIQNINFSNAKIECPCLIFAYLEGEEIGKAISYDIQEVQNKNVNLVLEKGRYNIIICNEQGLALKTTIEN